jgi:hypothetical protein
MIILFFKYKEHLLVGESQYLLITQSIIKVIDKFTDENGRIVLLNVQIDESVLKFISCSIF